MKKKLKGKTNAFSSVALYESDLAEILALISSVSNNVKISDNEFEYSNYEEVKTKRGSRVKVLTTEGKPKISRLKLL